MLLLFVVRFRLTSPSRISNSLLHVNLQYFRQLNELMERTRGKGSLEWTQVEFIFSSHQEIESEIAVRYAISSTIAHTGVCWRLKAEIFEHYVAVCLCSLQRKYFAFDSSELDHCERSFLIPRTGKQAGPYAMKYENLMFTPSRFLPSTGGYRDRVRDTLPIFASLAIGRY